MSLGLSTTISCVCRISNSNSRPKYSKIQSIQCMLRGEICQSNGSKQCHTATPPCLLVTARRGRWKHWEVLMMSRWRQWKANGRQHKWMTTWNTRLQLSIGNSRSLPTGDSKWQGPQRQWMRGRRVVWVSFAVKFVDTPPSNLRLQQNPLKQPSPCRGLHIWRCLPIRPLTITLNVVAKSG